MSALVVSSFYVGWEAYSANPIPPLEQPVIRTTFNSAPVDIFTRRPTEKIRSATKPELDVTGMKGEYNLGRVDGGGDLGGGCPEVGEVRTKRTDHHSL